VVADCSMPALQPQEMRGRQELPDELTAQAASGCRQTTAYMEKDSCKRPEAVGTQLRTCNDGWFVDSKIETENQRSLSTRTTYS